MSDGTNTAAVSKAESQGLAPGTYLQYGEHIDTIDTVNTVFVRQRRLSFTYGAIFFIVTLIIPTLTVTSEWWYGTEIWGGFTWNYLVVSLLYYIFLWTMAWTYSQRADKLDAELMKLSDEREAKLKTAGAGQAGGDAS
jgi:uncharacterized membrane protein (DUF485 family)